MIPNVLTKPHKTQIMFCSQSGALLAIQITLDIHGTFTIVKPRKPSSSIIQGLVTVYMGISDYIRDGVRKKRGWG